MKLRLLRPRPVYVVTAALAIGVPVGAARLVAVKTAELADHLGRVGGVAARIGGVDASLTATIRLTDVALGEVVAADAVEASVGLESLLDGRLGADEILVAGPRVAARVDRDGDSDLARLLRKLAHVGTGALPAGASSTHGQSGAPRVRRIVVSSGTLSAKIADVGEVTAEDVELVPDAGGVRVIAGRTRVTATGAGGKLHGELVLARAAAEVALPHVRLDRVLAVAGTGSIVAGDRTIALRDVSLGRLSPGGPLEARAALDDAGVSRAISAEVSPKDLAVTLHGDRVPLAAFAALAPRGVDLDDARATGTLAVRRDGAAVQLAVDGKLEGLGLDVRGLAPQPITLTAGVHGTITAAPDAISLDHLAFDVGAAWWSASGWLRRSSPASGQLELSLAPAPCADLLASLPPAVRGPLDGMALAGTFGGHARVSLDLAAPIGEGVELSTELANGCTVSVEPPAADVTKLADPSEHTFPDGTRALVGHGQPGWTDLHRMPYFASHAFVSAEDGKFFEHHGFDLVQIAHSAEIDLRDHRLARGGSTISQQLIKNSFLTQRRSLDRKIQEAVLTWRLESRLDKKTILERYLNVIELGPQIFGIRAAAKYWFDASPHELDPHQAAFLAAITAEPSSMSRRVRHAGALDPDSAARVDTILRIMHRDGVIDAEQLAIALANPLRFAPAALKD